jgi:hypothetical protein
MLDSLLDEIGPERIEIDWLAVRGPAFPGADNRLLSLGLVHRGYTPAVLFDPAGKPALAAEAVRKKCLLVERGRFAPVTRLNLEMLDRAKAAFAADGATEIAELLEISTTSLRGGPREADVDFLDRVELIAAAGKMVLVSSLGAFHDLAAYLAARHVSRTGFVLGVPLLRAVFDERHYARLGGGILEAFGRLFAHSARLYVHPTRDAIDGGVVTADTLRVAPHLAHLLEHLRANGLVRGLQCDPATLRTYSSDEVRDRLCSGDPSWQELVTPEVAAAIAARGAFGSRCDLPAR